MRTHQRPRRYLAGHWLLLLRPLLRYSVTRDAFVLRAAGNSIGPVLCVERRRRPQRPYTGVERRGGVRVA
jgi:hypothetical protein